MRYERKIKLATAFTFLVVSAILVGCGGSGGGGSNGSGSNNNGTNTGSTNGGGSNGGSTNGGTTNGGDTTGGGTGSTTGGDTANDEAKFRLFKAGDRNTIRMTTQSTGQAETVETVESEIVNVTFGGQARLATKGVTKDEAGTVTETAWSPFMQDPTTRDLTTLGTIEEDGTETPMQQLTFPGTLSVGKTWTVSQSFGGGEPVTVTFTVTGRETVTVPAGTYNTFRVETTFPNANPAVTMSMVQWVVPSLGTSVKTHFSTMFGGFNSTTESVLLSVQNN